MATNPAVPFWDEGNTFTGRASEDVTGKRFVTITGPRIDGHPQVGHSAGAANVRAVGVSAYNAASGLDVTVYSAPGLIMPVTAGEALDAGDLVYSDADGKAVDTQPAGAPPVGVCLDDAAINTDAVIKLL